MTPRSWRRVHNGLATTVTWIVVAITVFPVIWMAVSSLQTNTNLLNGEVSLATLQWRNYVDMWRNIKFGVFFRNSIIVCGLTMLCATMFATLAGYALARFRFPGADVFGVGIMGTQMIPGIMFLLPIYLTFVQIKRSLGIPMVNTYWGIIGVYTAFYTPLSIWIMRSFFAAIPRELEESAQCDGCSRFRAFWQVALPLAVPGLIATAVYVFLTAWDELLFAWALTTDTSVQTIPVGIRLYVGQYQNRYDLLMAASTVVSIPVAAAFFATQRYLIRGLTAGAVKG